MAYLETFHFRTILIWTVCTVVSVLSLNPYINTPLNNASGLYLESEGNLARSTSTWKFVIAFNFTNFELEERQLLQWHSTLTVICDELLKLAPWETCRTTLKVVNSSLSEVVDNNGILRKLFCLPPRTRRGVINGIGRLAKFLIGTMDDEDALRIQASLDSLKVSQNKLHHLVNSRISVVLDTIEALGESQATLQDQFKLLLDNVETMSLDAQNKTQVDRTLHLFKEVSNILTFSIGRSLAKQAELTDVLHEAKLGKLDRHLAASPLFINALKDVQLELPANLQFPLKPTAENLQIFDKIAEVELLYAFDNLTLQVGVPLVNDFYKLYKLTSIPTKLNNEEYSYIKTDAEYVAINERLKEYMFLKQGEYDKCFTLNHDLTICKTNFLSYNQNSRNCIIQIILNHDISTCDLGIFTIAHEIWFRLSKPNSWLYVLPNSTNIRVTCDDFANSFKIYESGILELLPGCKAFTSQVNLETINEVKSRKQIVYQFNDTILGKELKLKGSKVSNYSIKFKMENVNSINLNRISADIDRLRKNVSNDENLDFVNSISLPENHVLLYVILTAVILIILVNLAYIISKKIIKCKLVPKM